MEVVDLARSLAHAARRETLPRFAANCSAEDKGSDGRFDPVTEADRAAEQALRTFIEGQFPQHGISGEEFGDRDGDGRFCWSLDPIDGTRSFMCGLPTWTTLIALLEEDEPVLGIIDTPVLDETYCGIGGAAWVTKGGERSPLRTSGCTQMEEARLSTTDPFLFEDPSAFDCVRRAARVTRYGHDGYAYARLAAGTLDLVIESGLKAHDYNALIPVIRGAGGHIGDWKGGEDFQSGAIIAAATKELYDEAVDLLARA